MRVIHRVGVEIQMALPPIFWHHCDPTRSNLSLGEYIRSLGLESYSLVSLKSSPGVINSNLSNMFTNMLYSSASCKLRADGWYRWGTPLAPSLLHALIKRKRTSVYVYYRQTTANTIRVGVFTRPTEISAPRILEAAPLWWEDFLEKKGLHQAKPSKGSKKKTKTSASGKSVWDHLREETED